MNAGKPPPSDFAVEVSAPPHWSGIAKAVAPLASKAGRLLGASGTLRVRLVGDDEMAQAHQEFCDIPGTTDVLTFDLTDPEESPVMGPCARLSNGGIEVVRHYPVDADALVCVDVATRQAKERGHDVAHEALLYCVHAMLHCLGFDDHDEDASAAMHAMEDAVLSALGVGSVYAGRKS